MNSKVWWLTAWLLLGCAIGARAEVVPNLYQQEELVADQSLRERQRAIAAGLRNLLVRVSGNARVIDKLAGTSLMQNPARLVDAFRYESSDRTLERDGQEVPASRLILNFSPASVVNLLRDAGLPLWSANRPEILLWLVKDDYNGGRRLVSIQGNSEPAQVVRDIAEQRGLPLVAPLLDLEDRLELSAERLWQMDAEAILQASQRYKADVIVVGRYTQTSSGQWLSAWSIWHKDKREVYDLESTEEQQLLQQGVATVADYLADLYALVFDQNIANQVEISLLQVDSFADYIAALDYLQQLDVVREVQLLAVEDGQLRLLLSMGSNVSSLLSALELDRRLVRLDGRSTSSQTFTGGPVEDSVQPLRFRWPG